MILLKESFKIFIINKIKRRIIRLKRKNHLKKVNKLGNQKVKKRKEEELKINFYRILKIFAKFLKISMINNKIISKLLLRRQ